MTVGAILNTIGYVFVMEAPGEEYAAAKTRFWEAMVSLRSNENPELATITFYAVIALALREYHLPDQDEAAALVGRSDAERAHFNSSIAGRDWCDATLYDLCLDTSTTGLEGAAQIAFDVVQRTRTAAATGESLPVDTQGDGSR